jgi:hypothetical protein
MTPKLKRFLTPVLLGLLCTLPFFVMESVNLAAVPDPFPTTIFLYLWLMFALLLMSLFAILRLAKVKTKGRERLPAYLLNGLVMVFTLLSIINILIDQMPCFLGVPNCD